MNLDQIREIAAEYRYAESPEESDRDNFVAFIRPHARGRAKILFYERTQYIILVLSKRRYRTFRQMFPTNGKTAYQIVLSVFKNPNAYKKQYKDGSNTLRSPR